MSIKKFLYLPAILIIKAYFVTLFITSMDLALSLSSDKYFNQEFPIIVADNHGNLQNIDENTNLASQEYLELFEVLELYEKYLESDELPDAKIDPMFVLNEPR